MSETVIQSNGQSYRPGALVTVLGTPGFPANDIRPAAPPQPQSVQDAHLKIGSLFSPLNLLLRDADRLGPDENLIRSLLATEQFVSEWKDLWLPKFREIHILPVEIIGLEYASYHDAVCGMGGLFAHDVCRRFNARNLGETTWDIYFAAVARNAAGRWDEFLQLWKDSNFARVDRVTLWDQFLDEGGRAIGYERERLEKQAAKRDAAKEDDKSQEYVAIILGDRKICFDSARPVDSEAVPTLQRFSRDVSQALGRLDSLDDQLPVKFRLDALQGFLNAAALSQLHLSKFAALLEDLHNEPVRFAERSWKSYHHAGVGISAIRFNALNDLYRGMTGLQWNQSSDPLCEHIAAALARDWGIVVKVVTHGVPFDIYGLRDLVDWEREKLEKRATEHVDTDDGNGSVFLQPAHENLERDRWLLQQARYVAIHECQSIVDLLDAIARDDEADASIPLDHLFGDRIRKDNPGENEYPRCLRTAFGFAKRMIAIESVAVPTECPWEVLFQRVHTMSGGNVTVRRSRRLVGEVGSAHAVACSAGNALYMNALDAGCFMANAKQVLSDAAFLNEPWYDWNRLRCFFDGHGAELYDRLADAVVRESERALEWLEGRPFRTVTDIATDDEGYAVVSHKWTGTITRTELEKIAGLGSCDREYSSVRAPAVWRKIFAHLNGGQPYSPKHWQNLKKRELAPFIREHSSKRVQIRLDCPLLPDDFDDAKRY